MQLLIGRRPRPPIVLLAAALAGAVGVAAGVASGSKSVTNYIAYVNGHPGAAGPKLAPVEIGYVNQEGRPIVIGKTADNGVQIATNWINATRRSTTTSAS